MRSNQVSLTKLSNYAIIRFGSIYTMLKKLSILALTSIITIGAVTLPLQQIDRQTTNQNDVVDVREFLAGSIQTDLQKESPAANVSPALVQRRVEIAEAERKAQEEAERIAAVQEAQKKAAEQAKLLAQKQSIQVAAVTPQVISGDSPVAIGQSMAAARGWTGSEWDALYRLWMRESGWNPNSVNRYSGACGIPQALPCSKIPNPSSVESQINWGLNYIAGRYGSPTKAWAWFGSHNWY